MNGLLLAQIRTHLFSLPLVQKFIPEPFILALVAVTIFVNAFPFAAHVEVNA
jgi:hypothetical protein